jgi:succinoglycan biosynthesis protein ExoA
MTSVGSQPRSDSPAASAHGVPFISVVMPVLNEETCLGKLLRQLLAQNYDPDRFEILVVDGGSTDGTRRVVEDLISAHENLRLLDNPRRWSSAARNIGVRASQGEIVVVVDGHCELSDPLYLRKLADAFIRSGADCIGRPQPLNVVNPSRLQRAIGLARASVLGHHPASYIYSLRERFVPAHSVAVAYRRTVFERVGTFDECFDACEDVELNHRVDRAGLRCLLVPELAVSYQPRGTLRALFQQLLRYGRGRVRLLRKHRDTFSLLGFLPAFGLAGVLVGWVGGLMWAWWAAAYLFMVAGYGLLVAAVSLFIACRERQLRLVGPLCAVFVTVHLAVALGVLSEALRWPEVTNHSADRGA